VFAPGQDELCAVTARSPHQASLTFATSRKQGGSAVCDHQ